MRETTKKAGKILIFIAAFIIALSGFALMPEAKAQAAADSSFVIFIAPGHTPASGAVSTNGKVKEMTLNEAVSIKLGEKLQAAGFTVYLTNPTVQSTSLKTIIPKSEKPSDSSGQYSYQYQILPAIQNPSKYGVNVTPDLVLSVHHNSSSDTSIKGFEVYYDSNYAPNELYPTMNYGKTAQHAENSRVAAEYLRSQLKSDLTHISVRNYVIDADSWGVKNSICRNSTIPSVLLECGYLTNSSELSAISSSANQDAVANSLVKAITKYANEIGSQTKDKQIPTATGIETSVGTVTNKNTFDLRLLGVEDKSGIEKVTFSCYNKADGASKAVTYSAKDNGNGTWSASFNANDFATKSGEFIIRAYAKDGAGNSGLVKRMNVIVDKQAPEATGIESSAGSITNKTAFEVKLTGVSDATDVSKVTFSCYNKADGASKAVTYSAKDNGNGTWSAEFNAEDFVTKSGEFVIRAYAKDAFGNSGLVKRMNVIVDNGDVPTADAITTSLGGDGTSTGATSFEMKLSGVSDMSGVTKVTFSCYNKADGASKVVAYSAKDNGDGTWSATFNANDFVTKTGEFTLRAYARDGAGNSGLVKRMNISVVEDKELPTAEAITTSVGGDGTTTNYTNFEMKLSGISDISGVTKVTFSCYNKADGASKVVAYSAKDNGDGTWSATFNANDFVTKTGEFTLRAYARDGAGNSGLIKRMNIKIETGKDTSVPTIQSITTDETGSPITDAEFTLIANGVSDPSGVTKVTFSCYNKADGASKVVEYAATNNGNGTWSAEFNALDFNTKSGTFVIRAYARDGAGNSGLASRTNLEVYPVFTPIEGSSQATVNQMVNYFSARATFPDYYVQRGYTLYDFAKKYYDACKNEGIRAEVAWAQMCLETGYLRYGGDVKIGQFNFAGLGATGGGEPGFDFAAAYGDNASGIRAGVIGHVQHLKCYANTEPLKLQKYDPRWWDALRGTSPYVETLEGKWAMSSGYANKLKKIINDILSSSNAAVKTTSLEEEQQPVALEEDQASNEEQEVIKPSEEEVQPTPSAEPTPEPSVEPSAEPSPEPSDGQEEQGDNIPAE